MNEINQELKMEAAVEGRISGVKESTPSWRGNGRVKLPDGGSQRLIPMELSTLFLTGNR